MQILDTQSPACNAIIFYVIIIMLLIYTDNLNDDSLISKQTKGVIISMFIYIFFYIIQKLT